MTVKTITVTTSAQLNAALKAATGGETIVLSGSHKFTLTATDIKPASKVTITSINPDAMSTIATASLTRSSNIVIDSVKFDSSGVTRADFLNDLNIANSSNISLINSVMTGTATAYNDGKAAVADNAISILDSTGIIIAGNTIQNYYTGLYSHRSSNVIIEGNELTKMQGDGMQFSAMTNLLIKDNYIHDFLGSLHSLNHDDMIQFWTAASTTPSKNITITGNILDSGDGASTQGIFFGNEIARADPTRTNMYYQNVVIENNLVRNGEFNGITVYYVNGLSIKNNAVLFDSTTAKKESTANAIFIQVFGKATNAVVSNNVSDSFSLVAGVTQSNNTKPTRGTDGSSVLLPAYYPKETAPVVDTITPTSPAPAPTPPSTTPPSGAASGGTSNLATSGADTFQGAATDDTYRGLGGNDRIFGNGGNDTLHGDDGDDYLDGGAGNDKLYGGAGKDIAYGGAGNDTIHGEAGDDLLYGDDGNDTILGGAGNDGIRGGNGNDTIYGGAGNDILYGDAGDDLLYGDDGNDTIHGGDGNDGVRGGGGNDAIYGGNGADVLRGEAGNDQIDGGDGNDWLYGGLGTDTLIGGVGTDVFAFDTALAGNADTITDFSSGDRIGLETDIFTVFAGKSITADNFRSGSMAKDANDYLLYVNGVLYYDPDGNGAQQAQVIATLSNKAALSHTSFMLI